KAAETALKAEKAQVEAEKGQARERTAADQKAQSELQAERASIAQSITPAAYQNYERVRKGRKGIAVAEVIDGRCTACHIALRPKYFQDRRRGEKTLSGESCQRFLFYTPPQSVEDLVSA